MAKGKHVEAARLVKEVLPFPYALGLVCPKPCQEVCRRGLVEEEIAICQCHGYTGEMVIEMEKAPTPFPQMAATGKRVAVIGAGPAGLTAAYYVALKGHAVTVFDMMEKQGGMLRYGIPEYRLPKVKLDKELNSVWQLRDAEFKGGMKRGRGFTIDDLFAQGYDAIFLGIGAWTSNQLRIPGEDLPGVIEAINYLRQNASGDPVPVGQGNKVVVLGGGFTTFDCARTSRRLGADVTVVYRRSRKEMGPRTVIQWVAQGKLAAKAMDRYLAGDDMNRVAEEIREEEKVPELIDIVPYKPEEPQVRMPFLPFADRVKSFQLIENGYDKAAAEKEAARCLQCVCPDAGRCHLQRLSLEHGLTENKFHRAEPVDYHDYEYDFSHDFILRDLNKCINCTQCVRICRDVIGANCYGLMGGGYDSIVTTPWNVSLNYTDCVSCGACAETCPTGALMMRERDLQTYELDIVRCIYCGDCVEVCPHGALGETPNFEMSTYARFGRTVLAKEELAVARTWKPSEDIPLDGHNAPRPPEIRPPGPPRWGA